MATVDIQGSPTIYTVHPDILQTNILTRLDGLTLASAACVSSQLHALSTEDKLWRSICSTTWPSIDDPRLSSAISSFPAGHRSFYNDCFPLLHHNQPKDPYSINSSKLISAVDLYYNDKLIFSKVEETETVTGWFLSSPFRVDLLGQKETVPTQVRPVGEEDDWLKTLEQSLTLSWILVDPTQKRAANISTGRAVSVNRHWLTGEVEARFGSIVAGDARRGSVMEFVECGIVVTWGGKEEGGGGELQVREVSMQVEDMEGKSLNGKDSLAIIQGALERGKRKRMTSRDEGKVRYEEYLERKRERLQVKQRGEKALDMACMAMGVTAFLSFWTFIFFR